MLNCENMSAKILNTSDLLDFEPFCIIDGQQGLANTESSLHKSLVKRNVDVTVLDGVFENPNKLRALPFLKPKTIVLGTTGTYQDDLNKVKELFLTLNFLPVNVFFVMGEEYFGRMLENTPVKQFKIMPMNFSDDEIVIDDI